MAELLKIRLYVADDNGRYQVRIVPIGVPGAMMSGRLERELASVEASLAGVERRLGWRRWTDVAKHRLLQMYVSTAVLAEFWADLERHSPERLTAGILEQSQVYLHFGESDATVMLTGCTETPE